MSAIGLIRRTHRSPSVQAVLLCALLLAQAIGLVHGVVHAHVGAHPIVVTGGLPGVDPDGAFGHAPGGADCERLGALLGTAAPGPDGASASHAPPPAWHAGPTAALHSGWPAPDAFDARAPPRLAHIPPPG